MTSEHNVSARAETHANTYNDSGNKTALAGNQGLTTKTAKESQVADIQHTQAHPAAHIFPMMNDEEYRDLKQSIAENGLREPVWIMPDGLILDGRNRAKACRELGVTPDVKVYDGDDPVAFVVDLNLHRRHLNESQRSMVAANIANLGQGVNARWQNERGGSNWSLLPDDLPAAPAPALALNRRGRLRGVQLLNTCPLALTRAGVRGSLGSKNLRTATGPHARGAVAVQPLREGVQAYTVSCSAEQIRR